VVKPNYVTYTGSADVTIEKNTLQVQTEGYSGDYDGNPHSISIQTEKDAVVRYGTKKGEYTTSVCPSYVNVGRYNVYFEVSKTGYETFYGMRMVIIKRKQINELTFPTASDIRSGERLGSSILSEYYNTYGTFSWKAPNVIPEDGRGEYPVVFEPKDLVNYDFSGVEGYDEEEKKITRQVTVLVEVPTPEPTPNATPNVTPDVTPDITPQSTPQATSEPGRQPDSGAAVPPEKDDKKPAVPVSDQENPQGAKPQEVQTGLQNGMSQNSTEASMIEEGGQGISQLIQMFDNWQERKYVRAAEHVRRPGRVKIKEAKWKKRKISIRWKKIGGATGYQVLYSSIRSMKSSVKRKNVRKMRTSLKWNYRKKCYVKIRAYSTKGKKKIYGKWSRIRCIKARKR